MYSKLNTFLITTPEKHCSSILMGLVAKGPSTPRVLNEQDQREVLQRLAMGEGKKRVADYYKIEVDQLDMIRQQMAR